MGLARPFIKTDLGDRLYQRFPEHDRRAAPAAAAVGVLVAYLSKTHADPGSFQRSVAVELIRIKDRPSDTMIYGGRYPNVANL
ncbi:hypothetical protein K4K94_05680 [Phaeobacter inhibens]|uniref:hypothetical protein n=1 Tax=Phaeobacter inhibens TaxID=221822 RepID=UPI0021A69F9B|nr:hypothetical protein [Phaeobacter inhibens]UWS05214.1 hypothetical protein K4K94_05680 [Phaeobacter inhibens]